MSTVMDEARARAIELDKVWREAQANARNAWAELARLDLLRLAEEEPAIKGMRFESNYEYDDEGGYFMSVNAYPLSDFDDPDVVADDPDPDYVLAETFEQYGHEVLCVLCGVSEDSWEGQVTIVEAKERSF